MPLIGRTRVDDAKARVFAKDDPSAADVLGSDYHVDGFLLFPERSTDSAKSAKRRGHGHSGRTASMVQSFRRVFVSGHPSDHRRDGGGEKYSDNELLCQLNARKETMDEINKSRFGTSKFPVITRNYSSLNVGLGSTPSAAFARQSSSSLAIRTNTITIRSTNLTPRRYPSFRPRAS